MKILAADTPTDFAAIEKLAGEIWRSHYTPIIGEAQVEYMLRKFQSREAMQQQLSEGYEYYMLLLEEELVGYMAFRQDEKEIFLSKIYVLASRRGEGLGRQMLEFVESEVRKRGLEAIRLTVNKHNTYSIRAYLKMGFEKTRPLVMDIGGGFVMDDYEMYKSLG